MKSEILIHTEELDRRWIDRMVDAGVDILGLHPTGGHTAAESLARLVDALEDGEFRALLDYAAERGLEIEYEMHTASYLLPRALFAEHPEYFRMNEEGERTADANFCVSNPEALELYAQNAAKLASRLYRSRPDYYFWMDDTRGRTCRCPECRQYSATEQQLIVLNRVLEELRKSRPQARLAYLAYLDCLDVPQKVQPHEGVFLEFAPMERHICRTDPAHDTQIAEREACMMRPLLDAFGREGAKALEYWLDNSLFSRWKKPPRVLDVDRASVYADLDAYQAEGFAVAATFGCFLGQDYEALYGEPDITPYTDWFAKKRQNKLPIEMRSSRRMSSSASRSSVRADSNP